MNISLLALEVLILVSLSAICSGLNIALMSLDPADLKRKVKAGNIQAIKVLPLRKNHHLALAAILLTNVAVISATSLAIGEHFNGLIAGVASTLLIVVFGEIIPQALFARHALAVSARLATFLKGMIIVTYPISKPLQILLDRMLGHQELRLHSRHELGIIIGEHLDDHSSSEIDEDEVEIMRGALSLSHKKVSDIMTPISKVYWFTPETLIDAQKIDEIQSQNWSRIPIFSADAIICYGVLLMKDLVDIDFDHQPKLVSELPLYSTKIVGSKTALDTMFRKFIGAKSHLIPVEKADKIIGIVTIEDLVEEIIGHEIEDEADHRRTASARL